MTMCAHTHAPRGKRIVLYLVDGSRAFGKFEAKRSKFILLSDGRKFLKKEIRQLAHYQKLVHGDWPEE